MKPELLINHLHHTGELRLQLMDALTDADLAFKFPNNPTLGDLSVYMGDVERAYIDSIKTHKLNWDKHSTEPGLSSSVEKLKAWYKSLDAEFEAVLGDIPDEDFHVVYPGGTDTSAPFVDRGWPMPMGGQFRAYREAMFIAYGKAQVYLRAMGKVPAEQWQSQIG